LIDLEPYELKRPYAESGTGQSFAFPCWLACVTLDQFWTPYDPAIAYLHMHNVFPLLLRESDYFIENLDRGFLLFVQVNDSGVSRVGSE
jgi:hypothetical protein